MQNLHPKSLQREQKPVEVIQEHLELYIQDSVTKLNRHREVAQKQLYHEE